MGMLLVAISVQMFLDGLGHLRQQHALRQPPGGRKPEGFSAAGRKCPRRGRFSGVTSRSCPDIILLNCG